MWHMSPTNSPHIWGILCCSHTYMKRNPQHCQHQTRQCTEDNLILIYDKLWAPFWCVCQCKCVISISLLSSWPPYAELGAQAGSICRVNTRPQPEAAGPYKPHYSWVGVGIIQDHTTTHSRRTQTRVVRDGHTWQTQGLSQWQNHQSLGRYFWNLLSLSEPVWDECCLHEFIIFSSNE